MAMQSKKMDAIALLKADHRIVEDLFQKFESARSADRKAAIASKICNELIIHTIIEEEIFYPAVRGKVEEDLLDESYVEHDGAKVLISEILAGTPEDDFYNAKVSVLSEEIKHHVKEEERPGKGLFAQARSSGIDLMALAEEIEVRKSELKASFESEGPSTPETRTFKGGECSKGKPPTYQGSVAAE